VEWLVIDEAALDRRIRERAYRLWQEEGCPEGRADAHWGLAKEIIAIEDTQHTTLRPAEPPKPEPIAAVENLGELPTLAATKAKPSPTRPSRQSGDADGNV
jgi:hypothetical protein